MAADTRIPGLTALEQDYLWMFVDLVMAPNVLRKPSFRKIHPGCPFDSPSTFRTKLKVMSGYTREEVKGKMRNHSCCLLMDGGSILSKGLMNIAVGINRACGIDILAGDPGRRYLPADELVELAAYEVRTTTELEDELRQGRVFSLRPAGSGRSTGDLRHEVYSGRGGGT